MGAGGILRYMIQMWTLRRTTEKASVFLENRCRTMNRILLRVWAVKARLVKAEKGMRSILLETGGKENFVIKWQRP